MSNKGRGKKHDWRTGGEFKSGENHIFYGKKRPEHSAKLKGRKRGHYKGVKVVIRECSFCNSKIEALNSRIKSKNIFCNKECRNKFRVGINATNYKGGKIKVKCFICKNIIEVGKWTIKENKKFVCSKECLCIFRSQIIKENWNKKIYRVGFGENNPNWKNGISLEPYGLEFNEDLKEYIRKRDSYICKNCSMTEEEHLIVYGCNLHCHHIDYNKKNNKEDNLIALCVQCHTRTNSNRDYWGRYYTDKIKSKEEILYE